jgi:HK97 family phage portal protein
MVDGRNAPRRLLGGCERGRENVERDGILMRILGLEISRAKPVEKLQQVDSRGGWWRVIGEPWAGAFQRNVEVKVDNVLTHPTVYRCITLIAGDIAKMRLRLVQLDENGIWAEVENPAYSPVLRKQNGYQTRVAFVKSWMISKLTWGNTYVLKERDNRSIVTDLHVLNPRRVRVLVADNGDVFYELNRDDLSGLHGDTITVPAREIIHDRMNTLFHPLVGLSPISANGLAAVQGLRIMENSAKFFENGGRPGGVLTAPSFINQETADRLKEHWDNNYTGANAGKIAVLGDGLKYEQIAMSSVDAQLIDQLKWSAEQICGCFGVPAYMAGVGQAPLNNNVETLAQLYYAQCLQIHVEEIEALLDEGLGLYPATTGSRPLGTEFDLDDLLRMDTATMVKTYGDATQRGMAVNEFRRKLNLPPTEGGHLPFLQEQMWPVRDLAKRPMPSEAETPALPSPDEDETDDTERMVAALRMKFAGEAYAA